jgi:hypothetical protein
MVHAPGDSGTIVLVYSIVKDYTTIKWKISRRRGRICDNSFFLFLAAEKNSFQRISFEKFPSETILACLEKVADFKKLL